jgi:hypothetical protein
VTVASIQSRVPYDVYDAAPGVRISALKEMKVSPLRYQFRLTNPKESPSLTLGTAAHVAVLEPERFDDAHAVWGQLEEQKIRRGKVWDVFQEGCSDKSIITVDERDMAIAMRDAIRGDERAMQYLAKGEPEVSMNWTDTETGIAMKGRVDWITEIDGQPVLVGLKTTRDIRQWPFQKQATTLGYHLAWAAYYDGYMTILGKTPRVVEIVVENTAPHDLTVYRIGDVVLERGREEYRDLLAKLVECETAQKWPGAMPGEPWFELPIWAFSDEEEDDEGFEGMRAEDDE